MNRNTYTSDYSVPSLSLASSRSKRAVPTKDTNTEIYRPVQSKIKTDIMDRINRPPIFSSRNIKQSKISTQSGVKSNQVINESTKNNNSSSLNRNVYLHREQVIEKNQTDLVGQKKQMERQKSGFNINKQASSKGLLLRNPQSTRTIGSLIQKKVEQKVMEANKSLFERRIAKLLQEAGSYEKQIMQIYSQDNCDLNKQLLALEQCRKQILSFDLGPNFIKI